jgi:hypothetical protein
MIKVDVPVHGVDVQVAAHLIFNQIRFLSAAFQSQICFFTRVMIFIKNLDQACRRVVMVLRLILILCMAFTYLT